MIKRIVAALFICFLVYAQVSSIPSSANGGAGDVTGSGNLTTPGAMVVVDTSGVVKQVAGGLCEPYYTSATVIGIRACAYGVGNYAYTSVASCATSAAPASSGSLFIYIQKDGTPILGYSGTNVTGCTGWTTEQSVTGYPDDSIPIATFTWAAAAWSSSFTDDRRFIKRDAYEFSNGIDCTTTLGVTSCVSDLPVATAQAGTPWFIVDTSSSTTTYTGCPTPAITTYTTGQQIWFDPVTTNTGSSTLNVCALGAKTIQKLVSGTLTNLASGDMDSDSNHLLTYNGTVFVKLPLEGSSGNPVVLSWAFGGVTAAGTGVFGNGWSFQGSTGTSETYRSTSVGMVATFTNPSADSSKLIRFFYLPSTYTSGSVAVKISASPAAGTGTNGQVAKIGLVTNCIAAGELLNDNTWSTAQVVDITFTTVTAMNYRTGSLAALDLSGCTADGLVKLGVYRVDSGDTLADDADINLVQVSIP